MNFQYDYVTSGKVFFHSIVFIAICLTLFSNVFSQSQDIIDDPPGPGKICGLCSIY